MKLTQTVCCQGVVVSMPDSLSAIKRGLIEWGQKIRRHLGLEATPRISKMVQ